MPTTWPCLPQPPRWLEEPGTGPKGACKETEREEGGRSPLVMMTVACMAEVAGCQHGVKEAHVCDVSLAG